MNKKIVNNKLLFVSYEAVGLILNIHVLNCVITARNTRLFDLSQLG